MVIFSETHAFPAKTNHIKSSNHTLTTVDSADHTESDN